MRTLAIDIGGTKTSISDCRRRYDHTALPDSNACGAGRHQVCSSDSRKGH